MFLNKYVLLPAQLLWLMFIEFFKIITRVQESDSCSTVFWFSTNVLSPTLDPPSLYKLLKSLLDPPSLYNFSNPFLTHLLYVHFSNLFLTHLLYINFSNLFLTHLLYINFLNPFLTHLIDYFFGGWGG